MLLTTEKPIIINNPEYKFETVLFLPPNPERKAEGGLRSKGYFKHSYKLVESESECECVSESESSHSLSHTWYICDTDGNPVKPAPDDIQQKILEYVKTSPLTSHISPSHSLKELPLITVITVVYNGAKYLEQTIQSVINQTYPNVEYIIIDGGSTDGTLDIIRKYEDYIDYWVSEPDKGIYDAMNKGIRCSLGQWIGFLGSDDFYEEYALKTLILPILNNKTIMVVYGDTKFWLDNQILYIKKANNADYFKNDFVFAHPSSITAIDVFRNIGLFDINYKVIADYKFFLDAFIRGFNYFKVKKLIANYRLSGYSYNNIKIAFYERINLYRKYKLGKRFILFSFAKFFRAYIKKLLKIKETSFIIRIYRWFRHR
jgi:glycosyltransferase involved in cell wall biosynthesis